MQGGGKVELPRKAGPSRR